MATVPSQIFHVCFNLLAIPKGLSTLRFCIQIVSGHYLVYVCCVLRKKDIYITVDIDVLVLEVTAAQHFELRVNFESGKCFRQLAAHDDCKMSSLLYMLAVCVKQEACLAYPS